MPPEGPLIFGLDDKVEWRWGACIVAGGIYHDQVRSSRNITRHCGQAPECIMTGGAGWKVAPSMSVKFELVESLIFDGLLEIASRRFNTPSR